MLPVIILDVSKAFDKVWQNGLKFKMDILKLHPCFLRILYKFLDNRTASMKIDNLIGLPFTLLSGVPQGDCLSPTHHSFLQFFHTRHASPRPTTLLTLTTSHKSFRARVKLLCCSQNKKNNNTNKQLWKEMENKNQHL